jgi:hypothetical protein
MSMKAPGGLLLLACGTLVCLALCWLGFNEIDRRRLEGRMSDVRKLAEAYVEAESASNIDDLLLILKRRGIRLATPIPADPSKPCYRLVIPKDASGTNNSAYPNRIIIEETNTKDTHRVVAATADGSVVVKARSDRR